MHQNKNYNPDYCIDGDSIIQLSDGRIISYYFRKSDIITIYNQNTFESILTIDLWDINIKEKLKVFVINLTKVNSIFEINNNLLLVVFYQFLIEIYLKEKTFEYKIVYKSEDNILNINQLLDKRIVLITSYDIKIIYKDKNQYILKGQYIIKENWRLKPSSSDDEYSYSDFKQYYLSFELPNNRLLLNSFSTELRDHEFCGTHPSDEISHSKIIFIDLKNFEEIKSTEEFSGDAKSIVLEKLIIIQSILDIYIYDIISLDIIKIIKLEYYYDKIYKYNNDYLIAFSEYEEKNDLLIYKVEGNDLVKSCVVKNTFVFKKKIGWNGYSIYEYNNKFLFALKDKRIIMLCHRAIYLLKLEIDLIKK